MQRKDLIVGQRYVLTNGKVGEYVGYDESEMKLADGSVYLGPQGTLRFLVDGDSGPTTIYVDGGASVTETERAKQAREEHEAAVKVRRRAAEQLAVDFLTDWGIEAVAPTDWSALNFAAQREHRQNGTVRIVKVGEDPNALELEGVTIGTVRRAVELAYRRGQES